VPVVGVHHVPSLTRERYEQLVRRLSGSQRVESTDDLPDGVLAHVAWEAEDGFWVVDVFATQRHADDFARLARPIAEAAGIDQPPTTYPAHTAVVGDGGNRPETLEDEPGSVPPVGGG
jgi:hypothetical protein